jgi:hypothetical protein
MFYNLPEVTIRSLAKSIKSLNLFNAIKDIGSLRLFHNDTDLSKIQQMYLSYLYFYESLTTDILMKKVSDKILKSDIYEDAYMIWKKESQSGKSESEDKKQHSFYGVIAKGIKIKFPDNKEKS